MKSRLSQVSLKIIDALARRGLTQLAADPTVSRILALQGTLAARQTRLLERIETLADTEFSIFSEWGEDGIIEWLVHHNGVMPELFVEFGVENYRESNTRFLMMNRNWRGLIIDGSLANIDIARSDAISWRYDLTAKAEFITKDNINDLIISAEFGGEIGILSIDIDGNDYWVWDAITCVRPHFVIVEYNSAFGDILPLTVPYDAGFLRSRAHHSNLYYGASIVALSDLAAHKGYTLLGTNRAGSNAFFVRNDRASHFLDRIANSQPRPSRFRESRDGLGYLTYTRGHARTNVIADCPVLNIADGKVAPLISFGEIYSRRWSATLDGRQL